MARYFFGDPGYGWNALFRSENGFIPAGCERLTRVEAERAAKKHSNLDFNGYIYPYPIPNRYVVNDLQTFYELLNDALFERNGARTAGRIIVVERTT